MTQHRRNGQYGASSRGFRAKGRGGRGERLFGLAMSPIAAIDCYLQEVLKEAERRGYRFDCSKIAPDGPCAKIKLRRGQLDYEFSRLMKKLKIRDTAHYDKLSSISGLKPHPLFRVVPGGPEDWEKLPMPDPHLQTCSGRKTNPTPAEDAEDLSAFEERASEPLVSYEAMVRKLKKDAYR